MATFDFQKLGMDRISQNIKRAVDSPTGSLVTGDITKGEIVSVKFTAETTKTATVTSRRTGAMLTNNKLEQICEIIWSIEGTILSVELNDPRTGTLDFWVF